MDVLLGNENANRIGKELANTVNNSVSNNDIEANSHWKKNVSQENEFRDFTHANTIPIRDGILESMETFENEVNLRLSQEMDSTKSMLHSQIRKLSSTTISNRVIPEYVTF